MIRARTPKQLMQVLSSEVVIREHVVEMSRMKDALFPIVDSNIQQASQKQKHLTLHTLMQYTTSQYELF